MAFLKQTATFKAWCDVALSSDETLKISLTHKLTWCAKQGKKIILWHYTQSLFLFI